MNDDRLLLDLLWPVCNVYKFKLLCCPSAANAILHCMCAQALHLCLFVTLWTVANRPLCPLDFPEYWSVLPCLPPRYLPDPGTGLAFLSLLHWQTGSLPLATAGKLQNIVLAILYMFFNKVHQSCIAPTT